jgi:hypothetical protein
MPSFSFPFPPILLPYYSHIRVIRVITIPFITCNMSSTKNKSAENSKKYRKRKNEFPDQIRSKRNSSEVLAEIQTWSQMSEAERKLNPKMAERVRKNKSRYQKRGSTSSAADQDSSSSSSSTSSLPASILLSLSVDPSSPPIPSPILSSSSSSAVPVVVPSSPPAVPSLPHSSPPSPIISSPPSRIQSAPSSPILSSSSTPSDSPSSADDDVDFDPKADQERKADDQETAWKEWGVKKIQRFFNSLKKQRNRQAGRVTNNKYLQTMVPQKVFKFKPCIRKVMDEKSEGKLFQQCKRKVELELMEIKRYNYQCFVCHVVFTPEHCNHMQWGHRKEHPRNGSAIHTISFLLEGTYPMKRLEKEFLHVVLMCVTCNSRRREIELSDCQCRCCCLPSSSSSSASSSNVYDIFNIKPKYSLGGKARAMLPLIPSNFAQQ